MTREEAKERLDRVHELISAVQVRVAHLNDLLVGYEYERQSLLDIIRDTTETPEG